MKTSFEDSDFCQYFEETKFLLVIYKSDGTNYILQGSQMWNMPAGDLYGDAEKGWYNIQSKIKQGIHFSIDKGTVSNDLPSKNDNRILHIRPHTQRSAYKLQNGFEKGNISKDGDQLPNGEWMTKQSLWLNNSYVLSQLQYK